MFSTPLTLPRCRCSFHPHLHVLAADGVFRADGTCIALPAVPEALLAEGFRRAVLTLLVKQRAMADELRAKLLGWRCRGDKPCLGDRRGQGAEEKVYRKKEEIGAEERV